MINQDILRDLDDLDSEHISEQQNEQSESQQIINTSHTCEMLNNPAFIEHMQTISFIVDAKIDQNSNNTSKINSQLIQKSNEYASNINKEINALFRSIKAMYYHKFPELESIVTQPALYCKAVRQIQLSEKGQASTSFTFLSNHQKMSLQIALSTIHERLPPQQTTLLLQHASTAVLLFEHQNLLMIFLESCMQQVAPNLCQLVGSLTASKMISAAGGIKQLAAMPACNIQVLGGQRSAQIGFSQMQRNHTGIFSQMDVVKDAPKDYQMQLVRMLAANSAKCARADLLKSSKGLGARLREDMYERFQKIQQEGGLHRIDKPLPVPDLQPKKRRGGKRYRKNKELLEMSDFRKQQNRLKFGEEAEEEIEEGVGLGMLSQGTGKLKLQIKKQKLSTSKKMTQRAKKQSGLESCLNIGAAQGIELINPSLASQPKTGEQTIFSKSAGFQTVLNKKFGSFK